MLLSEGFFLFWDLAVFVETLDRCFKNVCELDIVYNFNKVGKPFVYLCLILILILSRNLRLCLNSPLVGADDGWRRLFKS